MSSPDDDESEPTLARARQLQLDAVAANLAGRPGDGARLATRGLRLLQSAPPPSPHRLSNGHAYIATRLLATLAKSTVEIEGVEPALRLMDRASGIAADLDDPDLAAFLAGQRGLILFRGGRMVEARSLFDEAAAAIPDESGIDKWRVLLNRGALFVETGEVARARDDLRDSVLLAQHHNLRQAERISLHNLGCLEFLAGDLPQALRLMQQGMDLDGDTQQGIAHLDRSRVLLAAGLSEEADDALHQAAELFRRDRCWQDLAEVDLTRAEVALLTDRVPDARRLAGRARDRFRRHGNDRWRRSAELVLLQADRAAGRPPGRLLPHARRLAEEFAAAGLTSGARTAELLLAELAVAQGRIDEADQTLTRIGRVRRSDPIAIRLHNHLVRAESHQLRGRLPEARRELARGLRDLATYQAQFGGIDLQSASAVHGRRLSENDLDLALRSGRPGSVLAAVERSRAVSNRIQPVTPPADPRSGDLLAELRRAVESAEPDRRRVTELQSALRARSWLNSGSRAWHPATSLGELRVAAEQDGCHLVTVTELRGALSAVTVPASGRPRLVTLVDATEVRRWHRRLSADLDLLANATLPAAMQRAATQSLRRGAAELDGLLAAAFPADERAVVISPSSELLSLPWPLLPGLRSRPITVAPSLSGWFQARHRLRSAEAAPQAPWSVTAAAGPGLSRARQESAAVAASWAPSVPAHDRPAATAMDLQEAMTDSRLVHVAAHGTHQGENPMFSSLTLTGGPLFAYELDRRGQLPEHVVLSACDVGRSTVRAGQETLGLTSALLQLGSACVVAGVARVQDDAAADIMQRYHRELVAGRTAAEALCLVGEQIDTPNPFVCFGASWAATAGC